MDEGNDAANSRGSSKPSAAPRISACSRRFQLSPARCGPTARSEMSIYATLWKLKFPKDGDDYPGGEWITVTAQGVPAHIGSPTTAAGVPASRDPYAAFLPPPVLTNEAGEAEHMRAVVFVTEGTRKGTARSPQEYASPLLVLTGEEYASITFEALRARICDALRGEKPRVVATSLVPGERMRVLFEDGTTKEVDVQRNVQR